VQTRYRQDMGKSRRSEVFFLCLTDPASVSDKECNDQPCFLPFRQTCCNFFLEMGPKRLEQCTAANPKRDFALRNNLWLTETEAGCTDL